MMERERSFDISKLSPEEADSLSEQLGVRVRKMVDECAHLINTLLKIYGMSAKLEVVIDESYKLGTPKKKKRGRKPKQS